MCCVPYCGWYFYLSWLAASTASCVGTSERVMYWFLLLILTVAVAGLHYLLYLLIKTGIKDSKTETPRATRARIESPFRDFLAYQEAGKASALKSSEHNLWCSVHWSCRMASEKPLRLPDRDPVTYNGHTLGFWGSSVWWLFCGLFAAASSSVIKHIVLHCMWGIGPSHAVL